MPRDIQTKTILNKTKRRDPWFLDDYTVNPYSGCSFNCLFCYIRGSKYGEHMEEKLAVKTNAVDLLEKALRNRAKKNQYGIIVLSSATDPYLQIEKEYGLTKQLLEVILKYQFPVHMITRSDLIIRDFKLLKEIEKAAILPKELEGNLSQKSFITFSFSTLDDDVARIFEPGATPPSARLAALKAALSENFLSGVSLMPLLPFISDTGENLEFMFEKFSEIGARYVFPATLTLFGTEKADSKTLVMKAVRKHYPALEGKYKKFFDTSHEMPKYYRDAFGAKIKELGDKYNLPDRIQMSR